MNTNEGYRIRTTQSLPNVEDFAELLIKDGQRLLPAVLELVMHGRQMIDSVIDVMGTGLIQSLLEASSCMVAGAPHRGKKDSSDSSVYRHGYQDGVVGLSDRKVRVKKPRLRTRPVDGTLGKEVPVPAYEAMTNNPLVGEQIMNLLIRGVSTRDYQGTVKEASAAVGVVGVSKSSVSREFIERSELAHDQLMARHFDDTDIVVIYIDGMQFGEHHVITALGVDDKGSKHVLGIKGAGSENAQAVKDLLVDMVTRGIKPGTKRLFVIDGGKAIRLAIDEVFGSENPVQRCVVHKIRNVQDHLPKDRRAYVKMKIMSAVSMQPDKGLAALREYARELEVSEPSAAASMREGLEDLFTVSRLGIVGPLFKSLSNTNVIESPQSIIAKFSGRVKRWKSQDMALRWHATACLDAETRMRALRGCKDMPCLIAALRPLQAQGRKAG